MSKGYVMMAMGKDYIQAYFVFIPRNEKNKHKKLIQLV